MWTLTLLGITPYPEDNVAIADMVYNGKPVKMRLKELNQDWLITDMWWPMHRNMDGLTKEASQIAILFGAQRIDFKLVGIRRYLCLGWMFSTYNKDVRGIFN